MMVWMLRLREVMVELNEIRQDILRMIIIVLPFPQAQRQNDLGI